MRIFLNQNPDHADAYRTFEVRGVSASELKELRERALTPEQWQAIFPVAVEPAVPREDGPAAPMLGTYRVEEGLVRFSPRFPLLEGQRYRATFLGAAASFEVPRRSRPPTRVSGVYPSAGDLPENLLRMYVYFSAPMRDNEALAHVHLLNADGQEVHGAFLDTQEELWDRSRTRLTLLLDPGRVKTGLAFHDQVGRALVAGKAYRLVVDGGWRDAYGTPLQSSFEKPFRVSGAALAPPEVETWQVAPPRAGTQAPLTLRFPRSLDHVLLALFIHVRRADGQTLPGSIELDQEETVWRFTPEGPWERDSYTVEVDGRLEDLAGNNLYGLFDRPERRTPDRVAMKTASVSFEVAG